MTVANAKLDEFKAAFVFRLPDEPLRVAHPLARCCWCGGRFVAVFGHRALKRPPQFVCEQPACYTRQIGRAMWKPDPPVDGATPWIRLPLPIQVDASECTQKNMLLGGAAGGTKSDWLRWDLYDWCQRIDGYESLLMRATFPELEATHISEMRKEQHLVGFHYVESQINRRCEFPNGSFIRLGHCESESDMFKQLSTEYDDIRVDEGTTFKPKPLREISSRARSSAERPEVRERGGGWFRVGTNPGGPSHQYLKSLFIDHDPDPRIVHKYHQENYRYIPAKIEDNPYLEDDYESSRLDILDSERYEQQRNGNWDIFSGQFFSSYRRDLHVVNIEPR